MTIRLNTSIYRRHVLALTGMVLFSALYLVGQWLLGLNIAYPLLVTFWAGNLMLSYWAWSGRSTGYDDPGLTLLFIGWAALFAGLSILLTPTLRPVMMFAFLGLLPFGIFGLGWRTHVSVCLLSAGVYVAMLLYFRATGQLLLEWRLEFLLALGFLLATLAIAIAGREMVLLRRSNSRHARELKAALVRIEELSLRDELTGLINRRQFVRHLHSEKAVFDREQRPFAVALFEIDEQWHTQETDPRAMDAAMVAIASVALGCVREVDEVAAFGRGRFAVLLSGARVTQAVQVLERLRQQVQCMPQDESRPALTISAGVAGCCPAEQPDELLNRAELQLAAARSHGGNRVAVDNGGEVAQSVSD